MNTPTRLVGNVISMQSSLLAIREEYQNCGLLPEMCTQVLASQVNMKLMEKIFFLL